MIKKYWLSGENSYSKFCEEFKREKVDSLIFQQNTGQFRKALYYRDYSAFNINNTTVTLVNERENKLAYLTLGVDKKLIDDVVEEIKSKGFKLEEIN